MGANSFPPSPPQARIKAKAIAINTFLPKNGYRPVEVNPYAQQRYTSYYIPPVYSPQQQFPLYSLITPQAWSATHSFIDPALVRPSPTATLCVYPLMASKILLFYIIRLRHFTTTSSSTGSRRTASNRPPPPSPSGTTPPATGIHTGCLQVAR